MNNSVFTKKSLTKKLLKHALYFLLMIIGLLLLLRIGFSLIGTNADQLKAMQEWRHSPVVLLIRFFIYSVIWLSWPALMRKFKPDLTDGHIKASRKPLIILLIVYELIFARDAATFISNWFTS